MATNASCRSRPEVTQLLEVPDGWALLFGHHEFDNSAQRLLRPGVRADGGMHLYFADSPTGPFEPATDLYFHRGQPPAIYAGRIHTHDGERWLLGWPTVDHAGDFQGGVCDPIRVVELRRGRLALDPDPADASWTGRREADPMSR